MLQQIDSAIAFAVVMLILSLIITALVQIVLASFDLRGLNLVWALTRLFHQVDPSFRAKAGERKWYELFRPTMGRRLAQAVSRYKPLVSGMVGRAKAIRGDELLLVLNQMVKSPPENMMPEVQQALEKVASRRVPGGMTPVATAEALTAQLVNLYDPGLKTRVEDAVRNTLGTVSQMEHQVNQWFDTVMDRSSDIFSAHSKVYTFLFAVVLAFGWHVDSGQILRQIYTNSDVRDNLNRAADSVVSQGEKALQTNHVTSTFKSLSQRYADIGAILDGGSGLTCATSNKWRQDNGPKLFRFQQDVQSRLEPCQSNKPPDFAKVFQDLAAQARKSSFGFSAAPPGLGRCTDGSSWMKQNGDKFDQPDQVSEEFALECQQQVRLALGSLGNDIGSLRKTLGDSQLQISTLTLQDGGNTVPATFYTYFHWRFKAHIFGTIATVLLLSLGAPFWFNTLRQLSNLKPTVAKKMEDEDAAAG